MLLLLLLRPPYAPAMLVPQLRPFLGSGRPQLRRAAVATLRHLTERDAATMGAQRVEADLLTAGRCSGAKLTANQQGVKLV